MSKNLKKALEKAQGVWSETEAAENSGKKKLPDGEYQMKINSMEVELSKASDRLQVKTVFEVVSPEKHEGKEQWRFDGLTEQGMPYFKAMAQTIGFEVPEKLKELPDALEEFVGDFKGLVEVTIATKDEFTNVYVNGLVDGDSDDDDDDDDDEPKKKSKKKKKEEDDDDDDDSDDDDDDSDDDDDDDDDEPKKKSKKVKKDKKKKKKK